MATVRGGVSSNAIVPVSSDEMPKSVSHAVKIVNGTSNSCRK